MNLNSETDRSDKSDKVLPYLSIDFMQPVLDSSFHIFLPVGKRERDAVSSRDDGNHLAICTLPDKGIQRNHLENTQNNQVYNKCNSAAVSGLYLYYVPLMENCVSNLQLKVTYGVYTHNVDNKLLPS